jgi:nucleoside-diphosphate-sugar epimerase
MKANEYFFWFALVMLGFSLAQQDSKDNHNVNGSPLFPPDFLTEQSVVLITGAAGFLGSELALSLHRTYAPKRILLVDRMVDHPQSQEELALFEFQRQRAFHVMQTLGNKGRFYRVDFSPMIPEYFDLGEVPVLDHIFQEHPDITHVVHLADPFPHAALQIVPREKDVPKAGMMEALMEQLAKHQRERGYLPHFCYASSSEVYPYALNSTVDSNTQQLDLLTETQTLTTPSSMRGASKMVDEMIAMLYYDTKGIYSVGLRFFTVYGPWGVPGSPLFEMAERAVTGDLSGLDDDKEEDAPKESFKSKFSPDWKESIQDFVYIDDAVDAIMAAMQFRPPIAKKINNDEWEQPHPIIFNVATGYGHSLEDVAEIMNEFFPPTKGFFKRGRASSTSRNMKWKRLSVAIGSTERARALLNHQPRVSLRDGIVKTLAWHYDRAFPYGGRQNKKANKQSQFVASQGIESCSPYDKECLRAAPVFPCASECSHESQCTKSYYDEVIAWTQSLTSECETVLYTVDLDEALAILPSAHLKPQTSSKSFLKGNCNLAFVAEASHLVQDLRASNRMSFIGSGSNKILRNGAWTLIPLDIPIFPEGDAEKHVLHLLPKLSPGLFFGSGTKKAIYVDSNILLDSIPNLLHEASTQPYSDEVEGATAMLIGRGEAAEKMPEEDDESFGRITQSIQSSSTQVQNAAYRMVRIAVADKLFGDGFMELLDSRWMVHTLQSDDARLFRCDVLGEVVQWGVNSDRSALEFVLGLHDMWSRVIVKSSGVSPWWIGDSVVTVPEGHMPRRKLQEAEDTDRAGGDQVIQDALEAAIVDPNKVEQSDEISGETDEVAPEMEETPNDDDEVEELEEHVTVEDNDRAQFVLGNGAQQEVAADEEKRGDSSEEPDDDEIIDEQQEGEEDFHVERDLSSYDNWMGILSSSNVKYFVRIVKSSEVGVESIDHK